MPLDKGAKPGSEGFGHNIKTEEAAGKPKKQAVAIAYALSREGARQRADDRRTKA